MKESVPANAQPSRQTAAKPFARDWGGKGHEEGGPTHLASLAAMLSQSPRVQTQLKLARQIQESQQLQPQLGLGTEINQNLPDHSRQPGTAQAMARSIPLQRMSALVVQRVITLTEAMEEKNSFSPEELYENIKGSREAGKFIERHKDPTGADPQKGQKALLGYLKSIDGSTLASRKVLLSQITKIQPAASVSGASGPSKQDFIDSGRKLLGTSAASVLGDFRLGEEVLYKVALATRLPGSDAYINLFASRMAKLEYARKMGLPIDWAGVKKTFEGLTSAWPSPPKFYLEEEGRVSLFGTGKMPGLGLTFEGLNSELDAILGVNPRALAPDEVVFSGSNYQDAGGAEIIKQKQLSKEEIESGIQATIRKIPVTKNVDVSFIDSDGVLHLIESAKDMNTLENKLSGGQDQSSVYEYLTNQSQEILHTAVGPLTPEQAHRNQITGVKWWYNVPPENLKFGDATGQNCIKRLLSFGAGLRSGGKTFEREELKALLPAK